MERRRRRRRNEGEVGKLVEITRKLTERIINLYAY